ETDIPASGTRPNGGSTERIRDDPRCGGRDEPGLDVRAREDPADDAEDQGEQEERQDRRGDRPLQERGQEVRDPDDRGHVPERVYVRETDVPGQGSGDDEGGDRRGGVIQRQDRGAEEQAGSGLGSD